MKTEISLFGVGLQGKSPNVTSQNRINCYYEFQKEADKTRVAIYGTPGMEQFVDFGDTPVRGMYSPDNSDYDYIVHRGTLWEVNNAGVKTSRGTLSTVEGRVFFADNGTQLMIVDGTHGYTYNMSSTAFALISDVDFPAISTTVIFHNGRFLVSAGSGRMYGSSTYDGTAWDATHFITAEYSPDGLVGLSTLRGEVILFGHTTTEFWTDSGIPGFPYTRVGGAGIDFGCASRNSIAKYDDSVALLAKNRMGEVFVGVIEGFDIRRISNSELEHSINSYSAVSDATGFSYMLGGHPFYQINFPTADESWVYDGSTDLWHRVKSAGIGRHRADTFSNFLNRNYVGDYENGKVYRLRSDVYTDNGDEIALELTGRHVFKDGKTFSIPWLQIEFESGVGLATGQGSNPQVMLQISKDGGHSWGPEIWTSLGKIGRYATRSVWRRLGKARDITFKIRITDPVKRVITNANMQALEGQT